MCTSHASTLARSRTPSLEQLCTHMHMPAALYADSQDNQRTYMRVSSRSTPVSAQAGHESQPCARKKMATNCCCWHASRRHRVKPSIRPADTLAARRRWLSPAAMALPGGRGRASATYLTARTLRTRAGAGQMAMCVSRHVTANENQFFEPVARGVVQG